MLLYTFLPWQTRHASAFSLRIPVLEKTSTMLRHFFLLKCCQIYTKMQNLPNAYIVAWICSVYKIGKNIRAAEDAIFFGDVSKFNECKK